MKGDFFHCSPAVLDNCKDDDGGCVDDDSGVSANLWLKMWCWCVSDKCLLVVVLMPVIFLLMILVPKNRTCAAR